MLEDIDIEMMTMTGESFRDVVKLDELYSDDLKRLPSTTYRDFNILVNSFSGRSEYIEYIGFPLLTFEFESELNHKLKGMNINTFVEIEAGTGALTSLLNNIGLNGKGYTLNPDECEGNWGMKKSSIFDKARERGLLEFKDIRDLELDHKPDMVVASWIPYRGGEEVIEFFENQEHHSEYFMLIGEGYGGCTANDNFHDWLEENFQQVWVSESYTSFNAIHDEVGIFKRIRKEQ